MTVELALAAGGATALTLIHEGFAEAERRDLHGQGWNDCLAKLVEHVLAEPADS